MNTKISVTLKLIINLGKHNITYLKFCELIVNLKFVKILLTILNQRSEIMSGTQSIHHGV